ncbi:hypothetical protein CcaverHIS002_0300840 [Cutaneotrichosporon cavernicola]|uniref:Major facilitator superfamily (MFS) profile domain-containing protein n=1 Tax=Cutaneotrichosporon cavernicola TaxID=279322 RepID=A0AA48I671_9TREE|nr:uncharacterized protein CcaverHIS019_0300820 [Cutaneotrichosporon cavernicola]BEI82216.1 hypothetical protein CcaverHIS002_0300840 [Cutaneotrichosporon cavernicola]BEI90012.1 hypothetical protein CcaverHIS019_0300820 [Cutaneotrichosporon cavernicola]
MTKNKIIGHAPDRSDLAPASDFGVTLDPLALEYAHDSEALAQAYGGSGIKALFRNWIALMCSLCACTGGLLFGFDQGLVSIVLVMPNFLHQFPEVDETVTSAAALNKGIMTALLELGAFMGAIMAGFVADRYSRKASIAVGLTWFVIGSTLQTASFQLAQLIIGRFVGGIGIGVLSTTSPMYISEIAPPNARGAMLALGEVSIVLGIVVMFYITYATRFIAGEWSYRLPFLIQMVPAIPLAIGLFFLPYSPRWLASRGRDEESLKTLCRLRRLPSSDPRVQAEWLNIRAEACRNREDLVERHPKAQGDSFGQQLKMEVACWVDMFRSGIIRRTLVGIVLMFFQQFTGINALIYYSPTLFQTLGLDYEMQLTLSGVMNVAQLVAVIPPVYFLDVIGRKLPLMIGSAGMALSHFVVAGMIGQYGHDWANHSTQAWVGVAFIIFFMIPFGSSWGPVPWSLPAEIFPSSRRAKGVALATCSNWFNNFIIGLITPPLVKGTGYGAFVFFGVFSALSGVWTFFCVPETKGITLEQMDSVFGGHFAHDELEAKDQIMGILMGGNPNPSISDGKPDAEWKEHV